MADTGNRRVDEFEADGAFVRAWGWGVDKAAPAEELQTCTETTGCQAGLSGSKPGEFESPTLVAVDNSSGGEGDVYVADDGDRLVSKFTKEGALVKSWGDSSLNGPAPQGQLDGSSAEDGPFAAAGGGFGGIVVDASGTLYVTPRGGIGSYMFEFEQDGKAKPTIAFGSKKTYTNARLVGIGVDSDGDLYNVGGGAETGIAARKYSPSGEYLGPVDEENPKSSLFATGLAVDPVHDDIYVDLGGSSIAHYGPSCAPFGGENGKQMPCAPEDLFGSGEPSGGELNEAGALAVDSTDGTVYAVDAARQRIDEFASSAFPEPITGQALERQPTSVVLSGTVDPEGSPVSECFFEYVTRAAFKATGYADLDSGGRVPCVPSAAELGAGTSPVPVSARVEGLEQGKTYHFRLYAANEGGHREGADRAFALPATPVFGAETVSAITQTEATITASLSAWELPTRYELRIGTEPGNLESQGSGQLGADAESPEALVFSVGSLLPGTVYYYQFLAVNPERTGQSAEGSFATLSPAAAGLTSQSPGAVLALPPFALPGAPLSDAEELAKALAACGKEHSKRKRASCAERARERYAPKPARRKRK